MASGRSRFFNLHTFILLGLVLGALLGGLTNYFGPAVEAWWSATFYPAKIVEPLVKNVTQPIGQVFLRMLIMTVIPLVFASLAVGVARLGDLRQLGRIGAKTFGFFVLTMTMAVVIGLFLVNTIRPGDAFPEDKKAEAREQFAGSKNAPVKPAEFGVETFVNIVPRNPIDAAARMDMLGVIFFALLVGIGLTVIDQQRAKLVVDFLEGVGDLMVVIINLAMKIAPLGVFALIFSATAQFGFGLLHSLGLYVLIVLVGLAIQMFGVLSALLWLLARVGPVTFFTKVRDVMITAFSTSSSNATLPTSLRCAEKDLGIPKPIAGFVLPLGATMNMNGTALFEGVTVVFLAQVMGIHLDLGQQVIVVVLAVLTAIGAAGVPGGSIPLLIMVLETFGIPGGSIAIVLGVDRLLDMCRTTLNVIGDVAAAVVVAKSEGHTLKVGGGSPFVPLGTMLDETRTRRPDGVALWFGDQSWTYARFADETQKVAAALAAASVQKGDRVGLFLPNCPELFLSYFGCFRLGAVVVPLNYRYKQAEAEYALRHSGAKALIVHESLAEHVAGLPLSDMGVSLRSLVGSASRPGFAPFADLLKDSPASPPPAIEEHHPAAILYTSGTTAKPKGVTYTHGTLFQNVLIQAETFAFTGDDVHLITTAACHAAAFTGQWLPSVFTGGTCVLTHLPKPEQVVAEIARRGVTRTQMLPASLADLVEELERHPRSDLKSWRCCTAGGDVVPLDLHRRFRKATGFEVTELFGMTEVLSCVTNPPFGDKKPGSIGKPAAKTEVRVVDAEGRDATEGEMLVHSPAIMVGYWNNPEATAEALKGGWMHTGDLARRDADGFLWFVGRKKEIIIRGGSNISPLEVEEVIDEHPAVHLSCVVGLPDARLGETVLAFVALRSDAKGRPTADELKKFVAERIAAYKVPERFVFDDDLPLNATGKVDRKALHARVAAGGCCRDPRGRPARHRRRRLRGDQEGGRAAGVVPGGVGVGSTRRQGRADRPEVPGDAGQRAIRGADLHRDGLRLRRPLRRLRQAPGPPAHPTVAERPAAAHSRGGAGRLHRQRAGREPDQHGGHHRGGADSAAVGGAAVAGDDRGSAAARLLGRRRVAEPRCP